MEWAEGRWCHDSCYALADNRRLHTRAFPSVVCGGEIVLLYVRVKVVHGAYCPMSASRYCPAPR